MQKPHHLYGFPSWFSVPHLGILMPVKSDGTVGVKYHGIIMGIFLPSISTGYRCQSQKRTCLLAKERNNHQTNTICYPHWCLQLSSRGIYYFVCSKPCSLLHSFHNLKWCVTTRIFSEKCRGSTSPSCSSGLDQPHTFTRGCWVIKTSWASNSHWQPRRQPHAGLHPKQ